MPIKISSLVNWFIGLFISLQRLLAEAASHRQNIEKIAEEQKQKYLDLYTILPSEVSLQLAEAALELKIQDQVKLMSKKNVEPVLFPKSSDLHGHVSLPTEFKNRSIQNNAVKVLPHSQEIHQLFPHVNNNVM